MKGNEVPSCKGCRYARPMWNFPFMRRDDDWYYGRCMHPTATFEDRHEYYPVLGGKGGRKFVNRHMGWMRTNKDLCGLDADLREEM